MTPSKPAANSVDQLFNDAFALLRAGKLAEAEIKYAQVLAAKPNHAEALRLRGSVLQGLNRGSEAIASLRAAVATAPNSPEAHYSLGNAFLAQDRRSEAIAAYRQALKLRPNFAEAWWNLGNALVEAEEWEEAIRVIRRALQLAPKAAALHNNLSVALRKLGQFEPAIDAARRALTIDPGYVDALNNLGIASKLAGRVEEAISTYRSAVTLNPQSYDSHYNLGLALGTAGRHHEEELAYLQALALRPQSADAWYGIGAARHGLERWESARAAYRACLAAEPAMAKAWHAIGLTHHREMQYQEAIDAYEQALVVGGPNREIANNVVACLLEMRRWTEAERKVRPLVNAHPDFVSGWANLSAALNRQYRYRESEAAARRALALDPKSVDAHNNLGAVLAAMGHHDEARMAFNTALALDPKLGSARVNVGFIQLISGELEPGWAAHELRLEKLRLTDLKRLAGRTRWSAKSARPGERVFVPGEQGLGDTLQFMRYLPLLAARGCSVQLEVQPALTRLLRAFPGVATITAQGEPLPSFDSYCPLLSLPFEFGTHLNTIPPVVPVTAPVDRRDHWATRINSHPARLRVGFSWCGNPNHENDQNRSIPLATFRQLFDACPGVHFFSLQKNPKAEDAEMLAGIANVTDLGPALSDFIETAAAIAALDLVVSVDTSVAHLAATLGKPVLLLLCFAPDWRWLLHRTDTPWYPSMTLFRQDVAGDWSEPLSRVVERLRAQ